MQFQVLSGFLIFLGSYLPLAIILAIQDIPSSWWSRSFCRLDDIKAGSCHYIPFDHPILCLVFVLTPAVAMGIAMGALKRLQFPFLVDVKRTKPIPNEIINYTFPYVVSFMGISFAEPQKLIGFAVFLLWMFAITHKSGQILMNPLLLVFRWKLYEATIVINGVEKDVRVLKRGDLSTGQQTAQTVQDFYLLRD